MDNAPEMVPMDPPQGQSQSAPVEAPKGDASGQNPTSGAVDGATPAGEAGKETLILGKFKSNEDLAKAYSDLESHNKKVEMDKAELTKLFVEQPTEESPKPAAAQESTEEDPMAALRPMLKDEFGKLLSPVIAKIEVEEAVRKYGDDFVKAAPQVAEMRKSNPTLSLDAAYKIVAFDNIQRTALNDGIAQANKSQEQAQKAQLETAKPSGFRPTSVEDAVNDPNVSSQEIADALGPEYSAFAETSRRKSTKNPK